MHKLCPECRKKNPESASNCDGCGADLTNAPLMEDGFGITMFGGQPPRDAVKPLDKAAATQSQSYGNDSSKRPLGDQDETAFTSSGGFDKEFLSKGTGKRPKKPWE